MRAHRFSICEGAVVITHSFVCWLVLWCSIAMVVGFTSDWLYTPAQNRKIAESLQRISKNASYLEIEHDHGHDSFLLNSQDFLRLIKLFLKGANLNDTARIWSNAYYRAEDD